MSELEMHTIITAISSSETEGFIAGTLFAQGWSVVFRAIDWDSLERFIKTNQEMARGALLIFGSDLPGISKDKIIHKDLSLNRVLPNYDMTTTKTSFTKNNVVDDEKVYERNLPLTSFSTSINKVGDTQSNVNRDVKLIYRPSFGQLESIPTIPMLNRMQDVKYMKDNTYTLNKKKISEMIKNR